LPLHVNENVEARVCPACREKSSFPQYEDRAPDNTQVRIQIIKVMDGANVGDLGGAWAEPYVCMKCGHVDFYTPVTRSVNP